MAVNPTKTCNLFCLRRCYVGVAFLDGCIYAFGGSDGSEAARLKSAEKFYPTKNVWKQLPDMHERRSDAGVMLDMTLIGFKWISRVLFFLIVLSHLR